MEVVVEVSAASSGYGTASAMLAQQVFATAAAFGGSTASAFAQVVSPPSKVLLLESLFVTGLDMESDVRGGVALKSKIIQPQAGSSMFETELFMKSKFSEI